MKIVCTKNEIAALVRKCEKTVNLYKGACNNCVLSPLCGQGELDGMKVSNLVEDFCEVEADG